MVAGRRCRNCDAVAEGDFCSLWTIALVVHGAIALKRVYGGRWIPTVLREVLLLLLYVVVGGLALAGLAVSMLLI